MRQGDKTGTSQDIVLFSWESMEHLTRTLAARLLADGKPDLLVLLQRGGLIPGVLLSHHLAVSEMLCVPIRRTTSEQIYADKHIPVLNVPEEASHLAGKDVVIVDDIAGSGETMRAVCSALAAFHPSRLRTFVYLVNLNHWEHTHHPPEQEITYIGQTIHAWAVFPWEKSASALMAQEKEAR